MEIDLDSMADKNNALRIENEDQNPSTSVVGLNKSYKDNINALSRKYDSHIKTNQKKSNIMDTYQGRKDRIKTNLKPKNSGYNIKYNSVSNNNNYHKSQPRAGSSRKKGLNDPVNNFNNYERQQNPGKFTGGSDINRLKNELRDDNAHLPSISRSPRNRKMRANSAYTRDSSNSRYYTEEDLNPDMYIEDVKEKR